MRVFENTVLTYFVFHQEIVQRNGSTNTTNYTEVVGADYDDDDYDDDDYDDDEYDEDDEEEEEPTAAGDMYNNDNQIPSLYSWKLTEYSQCSQSCGEG